MRTKRAKVGQAKRGTVVPLRFPSPLAVLRDMRAEGWSFGGTGKTWRSVWRPPGSRVTVEDAFAAIDHLAAGVSPETRRGSR